MNSMTRSKFTLSLTTALLLASGATTIAQQAPPPLAIAPFNAAAAKAHQEAWAKYLGVPVEITNSIGMKLVLIPPGEFLMGAPENDPTAFPWEQPQHRVRITQPFYLGATEVTREQYERVMGTNPNDKVLTDYFDDRPGEHYERGAKRTNLPVDTVTWEVANEFCRKLSRLGGERATTRVYRLPTEAEWEYACRAGTTTTWSFGNDDQRLKDYAWYQGSYNVRQILYPVAQKKPNPWGLYDMYGNVAEWVSDFFFDYPSSMVIDPIGTNLGSLRALAGPAVAGYRMRRGGISAYSAGGCRSAS